MNADGPEAREANRLERDTFDENAAADRADERERSPLAESIFEMARLNMESYKAAHAAGFEAGHHQGFMDGMRKAKEMLKASMQAEQDERIEGGA